MRIAALSMICTATALLAACTTTPNQPAVVDLSFRATPPLALNVGSVNITNSAGNQTVDTGGYGIKIMPPATAFENYARQRLVARGNAGFLNVDIQQAALTAQKQPASGTWKDNFSLGAPTEYTVNLRVGVTLTGTGQPDIKSAYTLERKATVPANTAPAMREQDINALIATTILDMDQAITNGLENTMRITTSGGYNTTAIPVQGYNTTGQPTPLR